MEARVINEEESKMIIKALSWLMLKANYKDARSNLGTVCFSCIVLQFLE